MTTEFRINDEAVLPGERKTIGLPLPKLYTHTPLSMPVHVVRGKKDGPKIFICGAIHGDELNGVEIIRRILLLPSLKRLRGTLVAVPAVNLYGLIHRSRYLPDRRDLNRSFPGSVKGSLAARIARSFMDQIIKQCTHGIDLHTGAIHRSNLPQIRANLENKETGDNFAGILGQHHITQTWDSFYFRKYSDKVIQPDGNSQAVAD